MTDLELEYQDDFDSKEEVDDEDVLDLHANQAVQDELRALELTAEEQREFRVDSRRDSTSTSVFTVGPRGVCETRARIWLR